MHFPCRMLLQHQPCTFLVRSASISHAGRRSYTAASEQYARESRVPPRIHVYGVGNVGKLIAHSLRAGNNPPPVTLPASMSTSPFRLNAVMLPASTKTPPTTRIKSPSTI